MYPEPIESKWHASFLHQYIPNNVHGFHWTFSCKHLGQKHNESRSWLPNGKPLLCHIFLHVDLRATNRHFTIGRRSCRAVSARAVVELVEEPWLEVVQTNIITFQDKGNIVNIVKSNQSNREKAVKSPSEWYEWWRAMIQTSQNGDEWWFYPQNLEDSMKKR